MKIKKEQDKKGEKSGILEIVYKIVHLKENYMPNEFENTEETAKSFKKNTRYPKITQEEIENFMSPLTFKEIELVDF